MTIKIISDRLIKATLAERVMVCKHLCIPEDSSDKEIEKAYLDAADNTILNTIRPIIDSKSPEYTDAIRLIYKELTEKSEKNSAVWKRIKSLKLLDTSDTTENMSDNEVELGVLTLYSNMTNNGKETATPKGLLTKEATKFTPAMGAIASGILTFAAHTATRLPFAAAAPGVIAGPVGIGIALPLLGVQLSGPAYRKIIPATIELLLIGQRIKNTPKESK